MATEAQTSNINPDAALLKGGPGGDHGESHPKDGEVHPDLKQKQNEKVKYELNGKTFESVEDMSKYVADLEQKVISQPTATQPVVQQSNQPTKVLIDGMTIDQLMFANPERYHQYMLDEADRRADAKVQQVENRKTFWNGFYSENPDLRGKEEIVDAIVAKNWNNNWSNLPMAEFSKVVSNTSRSTLKKAGAFNATEVRPGESAALSASGPSGTTQSAPPRVETNLVEEMKARQAKRLKSKTR